MLPNNSLLLLVDFNPEKGGIARVGYLMYEQLKPTATISFFGYSKKEYSVVGCKGNMLLFLFNVIFYTLVYGCKEIYCDHLGKASALIILPNFLISKLVIFLHDEEAWEKAGGRQYLTLKKGTHLLCNSDYTYQRFVKSHPEFKYKTKVCLLAGVPSSFKVPYSTQESPYHFWFNKNPRYCIFVSRLWQKHRYKGYPELLKAFAQYNSNGTNPEMKLVIVGSGDDEGYVLDKINKYSLENKAFLFNNVRDKDLVLFYKNCEALIFPSSREGFGYVFLEAMFLKKACIGLRGQPAEEIVEDGHSGILLPNREINTLVKVLNDIESCPEKYIAMGERGYEVYQNKFTVQHFKKRFQTAIST